MLSMGELTRQYLAKRKDITVANGSSSGPLGFRDLFSVTPVECRTYKSMGRHLKGLLPPKLRSRPCEIDVGTEWSTIQIWYVSGGRRVRFKSETTGKVEMEAKRPWINTVEITFYHEPNAAKG